MVDPAVDVLELGRTSPNSAKEKKRPILLTYCLAGPPLGGMCGFLIVLIHLLIYEPGGWDDQLRNEPVQFFLAFIALFMACALYSYLFGGGQAIATAVMLKIMTARAKAFTYLHALIAPLVVGLVVTVVAGVINYDLIDLMLVLAGIGVVASLLVRFLFRKWLGA